MVIIEDAEEFLQENPKRDMSKFEIYGAMYYLYELTKEESSQDISFIDYISFYCNKSLHMQNGLHIGDGAMVDSVFMLGKNKEDLFAYIYNENTNDEEELILVRL